MCSDGLAVAMDESRPARKMIPSPTTTTTTWAAGNTTTGKAMSQTMKNPRSSSLRNLGECNTNSDGFSPTVKNSIYSLPLVIFNFLKVKKILQNYS
jgi:hypothetical protein